jgi:hypothetical protein
MPLIRAWAVEFRDPIWLRDDFYSIFSQKNAALCFHDMIPDHPRPVTADWIYWRFHGTAGTPATIRSHNSVKKRRRSGSTWVGDWMYSSISTMMSHAISNAIDLRRVVLSRQITAKSCADGSPEPSD